MQMSIRRTGFSKRRFRRKTSFPVIAVIQKRLKPQYNFNQNVSSFEESEMKKQASQTSFRKTKSLRSSKKSRGSIDYKNVVLLRKLITTEGKILPRRINKLSAKQQRYTSNAIKSARVMGLLPFIKWSRSRNI